jgi:hypothetical protein
MILRVHCNQHPRCCILFAIGSGSQYLPDHNSGPLEQRIRNLPAFADCRLDFPQVLPGVARISQQCGFGHGVFPFIFGK